MIEVRDAGNVFSFISLHTKGTHTHNMKILDLHTVIA